MADDGRQLVFKGAELERIIPMAGAGMVRLGGDQVAAGDQFVALDGGVVVDGPLFIQETFCGVLDTNRKMVLPHWSGTGCLPPGWYWRARYKPGAPRAHATRQVLDISEEL